jgi:cytoplasmic iron level regulating protein YaaA (DUF328/UPF0246 family)
MLIVISPAKKLDMTAEQSELARPSQPLFPKNAQELVKQLKKFKAQDFQNLMGVSESIAELNKQRYKDWRLPFDNGNAKSAILAFKGDVYQGLSVSSFDKADFEYAQKHLRILSGLYGCLRPKDLMQAYRLEMGTALGNNRGDNLYAFWKDDITKHINESLKKNKDQYLVNLASNEYFKSLDVKQLKAPIITPVFKDFKNDQYKVISFLAKKARGMMCAYLVQNRVEDIEGIKKFSEAGYKFGKKESNGNELVFLRKT